MSSISRRREERPSPCTSESLEDELDGKRSHHSEVVAESSGPQLGARMQILSVKI